MQATKSRTRWTLAIGSLALFMVVLDNLIVTVALPSIREDLGASLQQLEWTINAYTLAFAVALIPGAAIGDRFGPKRTFLVTNGVSFFMYFGTFGSIFLLTQFAQLVMGFSPFEAGARMLVWTG